MARSKIEWLARPGTVPESWNVISGCSPISEGCAHCWAKRMSKRLAGRHGYPEAPHSFDVTLHPDKLEQPLHWRKPRTVFVASMGDLFHEDVPFEYIAQIEDVMSSTPEHTYLLLTKRPDRMLDFMEWMVQEGGNLPLSFTRWARNIWLGVTAENGKRLKERWPIVQQIPAAVKFLSVEPMLDDVFAAFEQEWTFPDWVIVGRPMRPDWARAARKFALCWGIPFFFKQWGSAQNPWCDESMPFSGWDHTRAGGGFHLDGQVWRQWPQ